MSVHHSRFYSGVVFALLGALAGVAAHAAESDETAFNSFTHSSLFAPRYTLQNQSSIQAPVARKLVGKIDIRTTLEASEVAPSNLDNLMSAYQSKGLQINRLSTTWGIGSGILTVGDDRSRFRNFSLEGNPASHGGASYLPLLGHNQTAKQIIWDTRSGFSVALEEPNNETLNGTDDEVESLQALTKGTPNLILSWQGGRAEHAGQYKLSALGRKLDLAGEYNGVNVDSDAVGWGVNVAGGWRFDDLFATLSVTLGSGIDSLLLGSHGSDVTLSSSGQLETVDSFSILPSVKYNIDQGSDLHVTLGRYQSIEEGLNGVETLDTINLGYTWSPWPSTKFGVEVVGKDFQGSRDDDDSAEIKFGAQQRF